LKEENSAGRRHLHELISLVTLILGTAAVGAGMPEVPVIDAGLGPCSVNFVVTDSENKPIYNAKIDVTIRYGFMGTHKSELEVGTDSDGKARVTGLLEKMKKPLEFHITSGSLTKTVTHNPTSKCDANVNVTLGAK